MKTNRIAALAAVMLAPLSLMAQQKDQPCQFAGLTSSDEAKAWYEGQTWKNGFQPNGYAEMDIDQFYHQYQHNPAMYDSIFQWLASIDPLAEEPRKDAMKWSHATAIVQDLDLRTPENCQWEQHRRTIDLQWDVTGSERYHLTRTPDALDPKNEYNPQKDVQNFKMKVAPNADQCRVIDSDPTHFMLFFPSDIHQACGIAQVPGRVRKIVVKIQYVE